MLHETIQNISRAINIDADRKIYTELFDLVRKNVLDGLKENEHFKNLSRGVNLCGSYADNLKVTLPDEFDVIMRLQFSFNTAVKVIKDKERRGNVLLDLTEVLKLVKENRCNSTHVFLQKMVNNDGYFVLNNFQQWLEGCLTKYLSKINETLMHRGKKCFLKYRKQGPAHTVDVTYDGYKLAIDFVPGFRFKADTAITNRKVTAEYWEAIPKPLKGINHNTSLRASFTESERSILCNKNQMKNVLRLMKKFRDMNQKLKNLKSYYIKTLFLWHVNEIDWNSSAGNILLIMFEKLETALEKKQLKYFWDEKLNLLNDLKPQQIESMYHEVKKARDILRFSNSTSSIINLFLTKKEQRLMSPGDNVEAEQNQTSAADSIREVPNGTSVTNSLIPSDRKSVLTTLSVGIIVLLAYNAFRQRRPNHH